MAGKKQEEKPPYDFSKYDFHAGKANPYDEYKFVAEMTDRLSARRQRLHSIFETMLTALLALSYFIFKHAVTDELNLKVAIFVVGLLGVIISFIWINIIDHFRKLIGFRFAVLMEMEKKLEQSVMLYSIEWDYFSKKRNSKKPFVFSLRERALPIVFMIVFFILGLGVFFIKISQ